MLISIELHFVRGVGPGNFFPNEITYNSCVCVCLFLFSSDKKCTYGIKCKFYHPERSNQSYLSLADELREKAQISTVKEQRNARVSPRQLQSDPGPPHDACSHPKDSNTEHTRGQQSYSHPSQVFENTLYWEDPRQSLNHMPCPVTGSQGQKEWPSLQSMPNHYYANVSPDYLDSGLGSYESQYSDYSHCLDNSHRPRPQRQGALAALRHAPVHLEKNNTSQSCRCCSHIVPAQQQHHGDQGTKGQPEYDTYPPHVFPASAPHHNSLPSHHPPYSGAPRHQQPYWSDPFQGLPQARTLCVPPSSHPHNCSHEGQQYHSWARQQSAAYDPQRLELRKKLQAIFNPQQVDTVMEMFPHVVNAEKLAAEILNLKAQRGIFG